jgi:head-tail adaptor
MARRSLIRGNRGFAKMRAAGSRKAVVAFERLEYQTDGFGNDRGAFEEVFQVHARLEPRLGGEAVRASRLGGVQPWTIEVRATPRVRAVDESWRIRVVSNNGFGLIREGSILNIRSMVNVDQRGRWIEFLADTGTSVAT